MVKLNVCVLFGGMSPEHAVSLRSAEAVLNNMDPEKYNIFPVGITREGDWYLYGSTDYSKLPGASASLGRFKDSKKVSSWASAGVSYCVARGIISGYGSGNFGPQDNATRAQTAKMIAVAGRLAEGE